MAIDHIDRTVVTQEPTAAAGQQATRTPMSATATAIQPVAGTGPSTLTRWQIDPKHSTAEFAVRHMMVTTVRGYISGVEGTITLDDTDLTRSSVEVTLDATSIDTREPQRDGHLRSADFFDVETYPKVTFDSTRVERESDGYRIVGDLTMRGVTRQAVLNAAFEGRQRDPWGSERAGFTAQAVIDRREFGLAWNQPLEAAGYLLGNDVRISIDVQAVLQA